MTDEQALAIGLLVIIGIVMGAALIAVIDDELLGWYLAAVAVATIIFGIIGMVMW